jgi:hypothetical protein
MNAWCYIPTLRYVRKYVYMYVRTQDYVPTDVQICTHFLNNQFRNQLQIFGGRVKKIFGVRSFLVS